MGFTQFGLASNDLDAILASNLTPRGGQAEALGVVSNIDNAINTLAAEGAKNFLVVTVPDLGKTPAAIATGASGCGGASSVSVFERLCRQSLVNSIPRWWIAGGGLNLNVVDTYSLIDGIMANPGAFGFTNVTSLV